MTTSKSAKHILVVEDSPDLQALLAQLFTAEGHTLSRAFNGREALDLLHVMPTLPSLIFLDIMMPVMDGIEFRKAQRDDPRLSLIPVVVMSADANFRTKTRQLGITEFVRKPIIDVENLLEIVERVGRKITQQ